MVMLDQVLCWAVCLMLATNSQGRKAERTAGVRAVLGGVSVSIAATPAGGQNARPGKGFLLHKNKILDHFIKIKFLWFQRGLLKDSGGDTVC